MPHYDPYNFVSQKSLGYLLKINHTLMLECADRILTAHGMSFVQWIALLKLSEGTAETASDLCRQMFHDNGAITRVLDQLEEQGLLARQRSLQDRRVVHLHITEAGRSKVGELTPLVVNSLNAALEPFSAAEFAEFTRLLEKLKTRLQQHAAEPQPATPGEST